MRTETPLLLTLAKQEAEDSRAYLLNTFSFVPDDKLSWSPSVTSRGALEIVAHCAVYNNLFAQIIARTPGLWEGDGRSLRKEQEAEIKTRQVAIQAIEESFAKVQAALDGMRQEDFEAVVQTPGITRSMTFFMFLPARHTDNHACQIDFLQTCWGDLDIHS